MRSAPPSQHAVDQRLPTRPTPMSARATKVNSSTNASRQGPRGHSIRSTSGTQLPFTRLGLGLGVAAALLLVGVGTSRLWRRTQ